MNEKVFVIHDDGRVVETAGTHMAYSKLWKSSSSNTTKSEADHYAYCKSCAHYNVCLDIDLEDLMYNLASCVHYISVMTPEQFKEEMQKLSKDDDVELRHEAMDGLLLKVLRSLGYGEGVDIFVNTKMWYA